MTCPSRSIRDLLDCISIVGNNVFGGMTVAVSDGQAGMRSQVADDLAMCNQIAFKLKAPHQTALRVERHNALIRSAVQRAESQVFRKSLFASFVAVFGLVGFMHDVFGSINSHTPYQVLFGRQPHPLPPLEGGYHGVVYANLAT